MTITEINRQKRLPHDKSHIRQDLATKDTSTHKESLTTKDNFTYKASFTTKDNFTYKASFTIQDNFIYLKSKLGFSVLSAKDNTLIAPSPSTQIICLRTSGAPVYKKSAYLQNDRYADKLFNSMNNYRDYAGSAPKMLCSRS